jgi:hypothetical protein
MGHPSNGCGGTSLASARHRANFRVRTISHFPVMKAEGLAQALGMKLLAPLFVSLLLVACGGATTADVDQPDSTSQGEKVQKTVQVYPPPPSATTTPSATCQLDDVRGPFTDFSDAPLTALGLTCPAQGAACYTATVPNMELSVCRGDDGKITCTSSQGTVGYNEFGYDCCIHDAWFDGVDHDYQCYWLK